MAKTVKLSAAQLTAYRIELTALLADELPRQGMRRGLARWRSRRAQSERFIARMYAKYQAEGAEAGTGKPFIEWLKSLNWAAIIAFIFTLFA